MSYRLTISERADEHIDNIISYVVNVLKNPTAATAILSDIDEAYDRLEKMPNAYGYCADLYLAQKGYRKIILSHHDYVIIYRITGDEIFVAGVFHMLENYADKI